MKYIFFNHLLILSVLERKFDKTTEMIVKLIDCFNVIVLFEKLILTMKCSSNELPNVHLQYSVKIFVMN